MQLACGRALAWSHSFARTSPALPVVRAMSQAHRLQPCRAASGGDGGSGGGDASQQIAPPNVRELARMANIAITDEEVADWTPKIEGIVEWFGQLEKIDVEGVPPALRADVEAENTLREDVVVQAEPDLLQQAADREGPFVRVPKIATAADS